MRLYHSHMLLLSRWITRKKRINKMPVIFLVSALLSAGILVTSCGGNKQDTDSQASNSSDISRTASISLSIRWPEKPSGPTKLIPLAAQSIKIELKDSQGNLIGNTPKVVARPTTGNTSNVLFTSLPPGSVSVKATAFPNADAAGVAQATGTITTTITAGQTTAAALTMDSTVANVKINGNNGTALTVGSGRVLTAQALNSAGETVLVAPSQWEWTSSNVTNFTLTPSGESASLIANSVGLTTITLKDTESGKTITTTISSRNMSFADSKIAYVCGSFRLANNDYVNDICTIRPDGSNQTRLTDTNYSVYNSSPLFSPDGKKIIFVRNSRELYSMNADGSGLTLLDSATGDFTIGITVFSPDGSKIAFIKDNPGPIATRARFSQIYAMNIDGSNKINLTQNTLGDLGPSTVSWSVDSKKVIFTSSNSFNTNAANGTFIVDPDGNNLNSLTGDLVWLSRPKSPDGKKVAYVLFTSTNINVYTRWTDGTNETLVFTAPSTPPWGESSLGAVIWSPDGSKLALTSNYTGVNEIYVMDADGKNRQRIGQGNIPIWSPDGTKIAFSTVGNSFNFSSSRLNEIYVANIDGSNLVRLTNNDLPDIAHSWAAISQ
jgi:Tol biopolymer transport system component